MEHKSVKTLQSEEKALQVMNNDYQQLISNLTDIATTVEHTANFLYFNGDFTMTLVSKDVINVKRIRVSKPPYELGHYSEYFSFRVDKPGVINVGKHWGDTAWFAAAPDCFIHIRNGEKQFTNKIK
jgi:hypothetical protein